MALEPAFTECNSSPSNWLANLRNMDPVTLERVLLEQIALSSALPLPPLDLVCQYEGLSIETQPVTQPTNANDGSEIYAAASPVSPPSPQPAATIPPKLLEIPQRVYERKQRDYVPSGPILFDVDGLPGLNMYDALHDKFTGLEGRDDLVLQGAKKAVTCRFLFPGYPNGSFQIFTTYWNKEHNPIIRSKLGHEVAKGLKKYLDEMTTHPIDTLTVQQWKVGEGYMHLENMFLAKLESVSMGSYQPLIYVVDAM